MLWYCKTFTKNTVDLDYKCACKKVTLKELILFSWLAQTHFSDVVSEKLKHYIVAHIVVACKVDVIV